MPWKNNNLKKIIFYKHLLCILKLYFYMKNSYNKVENNFMNSELISKYFAIYKK